MDEPLEARIRKAWEARDLQAAATIAIEGYGPEVLGFLIATTRSDERGAEAFSILCEDLWRGLPGFKWRCAFRTWMYTLARHAAVRLHRSPHLRQDRNIPLSAISEVSLRVASASLSRQRAEDRFAKIRATLTPEDETLLVLRVDKKMAWNDIARVLEGDEEMDEEQQKRVSARVRKRFQLLKDQLRDLVKSSGLVEE